MQVGSILIQGRLPHKSYDQYSLQADEDENVPVPPPPKDGNVAGKPRNFLQYAPSWAKHPDYDRVRTHLPHVPGRIITAPSGLPVMRHVVKALCRRLRPR